MKRITTARRNYLIQCAEELTLRAALAHTSPLLLYVRLSASVELLSAALARAVGDALSVTKQLAEGKR